MIIEEYHDLEVAESGLRDALAQMTAGRESAVDEVEKWARVLDAHPDAKAKEEEEKGLGSNRSSLSATPRRRRWRNSSRRSE